MAAEAVAAFVLHHGDVREGQAAGHRPAHPGDHLVRRGVRRIDRDARPDGLDHRIGDGIPALDALQSLENQRMMGDDHVAALLHGLADEFRRAVETDEDAMDLVPGRADAKPAVVPSFLDGQGRELLDGFYDVADCHRLFLTSCRRARISFREFRAFTRFSTLRRSSVRRA